MLNGIDTSHYSNLTVQGLKDMTWRNRLYFNFLKASEGANTQDNKFVQYWQMSRNAGLVCGAYHFLRPLVDPIAQANNFLAMYRQVSRAGVLPPVVDIEWAQSATGEQWSKLSPAQRLAVIRAFMLAVESATSTKLIIYTANNFWRDTIYPACSPADNQYFAARMSWIVNLNNKGLVPQPWTNATFWQTHFGENGTGTDPYAYLDQDTFNAGTLQLLNSTVPGFTIAKGFPRSYIVYDLQNALKQKGLLADAPDGYFGNNTLAAVQQFQSANGLVANGIVDAQTWNKLLA